MESELESELARTAKLAGIGARTNVSRPYSREFIAAGPRRGRAARFLAGSARRAVGAQGERVVPGAIPAWRATECARAYSWRAVGERPNSIGRVARKRRGAYPAPRGVMSTAARRDSRAPRTALLPRERLNGAAPVLPHVQQAYRARRTSRNRYQKLH